MQKVSFLKLSFLAVFICSFFFLLLIRLFDLQIIRGEHFYKLANENRFFELPIAAHRGIFLDRYGKPLVLNKKRYFKLEDAQSLFSAKQPLEREEALLNMANDSASVSYELYRDYLFPQSMAHVLGFTAKVSTDDLLADDYLLISDSIGKSALERKYERPLRGVRGKELFEINTLGQKERLLEKTEAVTGQNIETTLDPYLSEISFKALGQEKGAILIADAKTNEVLVLVSNPSFDLNDFSQNFFDEVEEAQRKTRIEAYFADENQVFFNRAVGAAYPPGSVFKLVTAIAGLETGSIDQGTAVVDEGILKVGDWEYANWYYTQYGRTEGSISLIRAISRSNDIFFYKTAEWVGPDKLAAFARDFGFGQKTGIELGSEANGLVPDPAWKEEVIGERWYLGNTYHFGIGQGDLLVSPVQILQMVQTFANKGTLCRPTLLKNQAERCSGLSLKRENLDLVLKGMLNACSSGGTAFPFFKFNQKKRAQTEEGATALDPFQEINNGAIACKTGTAEFGAADARGYRKTHAWFVAIVGVGELKEEAEKLTEEQTLSESSIEEVSSSAESIVAALMGKKIFDKEKRAKWLAQLKEHAFPDTLVIVALIESNDDNPYKEGSQDAAPVVKEILDWIFGGE
ncbi:MAG: penicillin-binding transpeptidase domain-containing protein [Candidatus Woesebacteria bacterium]|jgi:penicillin-binding protein 2